jgi:hypothetical protein
MSRTCHRQRGAALIALLAVIVLAAGWMLVSRVRGSSSDILAAKRARNAIVLNQAKQALIGYVAAQAVKPGENNPGNLPCPENPGDFDSTTGREGLAGINCGTGSGQKVGRFPWRTLGLDRLVDADGEPLWYVVSKYWGVDIGANTYINSNSVGPLTALTVDGFPNAAVALIIAPGRALSVSAGGGCTAWNQVRPMAGNPDWRNYLECWNATPPADPVFVTRGPSGSFNDQVLRVTTADLLPEIEAAIAQRMEREISPKLKQVYTTANGWTLSPTVALPAGTSVYPYAAPFSNPEATPDAPNNPDRTVYTGVAGTYIGLIPIAAQMPNSVAWVNPATGFTLTLLSAGVLSTSNCSASSSTVLDCTFVFVLAPSFALDVDASNIGTGFRQAPGLQANLSVTGGTGTVTNSLRSDGSARVRINVTPSSPVIGTIRIRLPINAADAVINDATTAWYFRNDWHKFTLYAVSKGFAPGPGSGPGGGGGGGGAPTPVGACGGANPPCLTINDGRYPATTTGRAALILAGRALQGQSRPSGVLSNYLEGENLSPLDEVLRRGAATSAINDRIVAVDP